MTDTPFDIRVESGFEPVADAFKANFEDGLEHGAAFCVVQDGQTIINLKGGWADRKKTQPLSDDSLVAVFSSGKAVAALVLATLADDDCFGYEQPISSVWSKFDGWGRGDLSIAQILSHQSGVSGIADPDWAATDWYNWEKTCRAMENQEPLYSPGSASGYHPITYGFFAGQIAKNTDAFGRSLGQILREDICEPHGLDIWIGLPAKEHFRCADMIKPRALANLGDINPATKAAFMQKGSSPGGAGVDLWRASELAGSSCHATAESLAHIMQMAVDGKVKGEQFLAQDMQETLRHPRISGRDLVLPYDVTWAAGLMCNTPNFFYGPNMETVGHSGWGGSCVFADPETGISAAYVMTRQDNTLIGDPRPQRIIDSLYGCL